MSWGDVWVSAADARPSIEGPGPQDPWLLAGDIARDEKAFIEAVHRLRDTRDRRERAVDFHLRVRTPDVALAPAGARKARLTFEPSGLWVAVDLSVDVPRFVVFTQRVHTATLGQRPSGPDSGPRPLAVIPLRGRARSRASALEWGFRAPRD